MENVHTVAVLAEDVLELAASVAVDDLRLKPHTVNLAVIPNADDPEDLEFCFTVASRHIGCKLCTKLGLADDADARDTPATWQEAIENATVEVKVYEPIDRD